MKYIAIGLIAVFGLGLTGCSTDTAKDDLTNCRDANNLREEYATDYMLTQPDKISELNIDLSERLAEISERTTSVELSEALSSDANNLDQPGYNQFFDFARFQFISVCMDKYQTTFFTPE
jgi:hypothetical protein